jgi:hypothetical protein
MKPTYLRVEGSQTLVRDPYSGAIINNDDAGYKSYIAVREANERKRQEQQTVRQEIDSLKNDMTEIKGLLLQLLEKK